MSSNAFAFTCVHLSDAFIQSVLRNQEYNKRLILSASSKEFQHHSESSVSLRYKTMKAQRKR